MKPPIRSLSLRSILFSLSHLVHQAVPAFRRVLGSLGGGVRRTARLGDEPGWALDFRGLEAQWGTVQGLVQAAPAPPEPKVPRIKVTSGRLRGGIRVPLSVLTAVDVRRPVETILESYGKSLRRSLRSLEGRFRYEQVLDLDEVRRLEQTMLRPYAEARHEGHTVHLSWNWIRYVVQSRRGAMFRLLDGDREVGCQIGNLYIRGGAVYWNVNRLGFLPEVFQDVRAWTDANSASLFLSLNLAQNFGAQYCDYGDSPSRPGDGLLEWKRRRKGFLLIDWFQPCVWISVPRPLRPAFYWRQPLLEARGRALTLHLGLPAGTTAAAVQERYHEMGFQGLRRVVVHTVGPLTPELAEAVRGLFQESEILPPLTARPIP